MGSLFVAAVVAAAVVVAAVVVVAVVVVAAVVVAAVGVAAVAAAAVRIAVVVKIAVVAVAVAGLLEQIYRAEAEQLLFLSQVHRRRPRNGDPGEFWTYSLSLIPLRRTGCCR